MNNNCCCIAAVIAIETATDDQRVATATCNIRPRECGTVGSKLVYFPNVFASLYHPGQCQVSCGPSNNGSLNGVVVRAFHVAILHAVCLLPHAACCLFSSFPSCSWSLWKRHHRHSHCDYLHFHGASLSSPSPLMLMLLPLPLSPSYITDNCRSPGNNCGGDDNINNPKCNPTVSSSRATPRQLLHGPRKYDCIQISQRRYVATIIPNSGWNIFLF